MEQPDVIIIGAGPAGLATGAALRQRNIPFLVLEQSDQVAHSWHNHYERLHLHTVKELSALPYQPFPKEFPRYVPRKGVVSYLTDYARNFDIEPVFNQKVTGIVRQEDHWEVRVAGGTAYLAKHVIITTGINRQPVSPTFEGQSEFRGTLMHSRKYRTGADFKGQKVLVVGMGNTGAEIALDLHEQGAKPYISVRGAVNIIPRDFLGRPSQETAMLLAKVPTAVSDTIGTIFRAISIGNLSKYGIQTPAISPSKQLRTEGKTPVMDIGTVKAIKSGYIKVVPAIQRFHEKSITFTDGSTLEPEAVILCTGYHPGLEELLGKDMVPTDAHGVPKEFIGTGAARGLYFVGYDNYSPGGILGLIQKDAIAVAKAVKESYEL